MGGGFVHAAPLNEHPLRAVHEANLLHFFLQRRGFLFEIRELHARCAHHGRRLAQLLRRAGLTEREHACVLHLIADLIVTVSGNK